MADLIGSPQKEELEMYEIFKRVTKSALLNYSIEGIKEFIKVINENNKLIKINFKNIFYEEAALLQKTEVLSIEEMITLIEDFNKSIK